MLGFFEKERIDGMTLGEVSELLGWMRTPTAMVFTPINLREERRKFFESNTYNPQFRYNIVKNSNDRIADTLKDVKSIIDVDPRLSEFYLELIKSKAQANELMYAVGDNKLVTTISKDRYKMPTAVMFRNAARVLRKKVSGYDLIDYKKAMEGDYLGYQEIADAFHAAFEILGLHDWTVSESKNIKGSSLKVGIKSREVFMSPGIKRKPVRLKKALVHELTHILRSENGLATGYEALSKPTLPSYLDVEEGLTGYNEESMGLMTYRDLRNRAAKAWAVYVGENMTFRELYNACLAFVPSGLAWAITFSAKKGLGDTSKPGVYTRDAAYFRGFRRVRNRIKKDPTMYDKLYAGKINFSQVKWVEEGLIKKPKMILDKETVNRIYKEAGL